MIDKDCKKSYQIFVHNSNAMRTLNLQYKWISNKKYKYFIKQHKSIDPILFVPISIKIYKTVMILVASD